MGAAADIARVLRRAQDASMIESLRVTLNPSAGLSGDTRFQFGTESKSNYVPFPEAYNYRPLPKVYGQSDMAAEVRKCCKRMHGARLHACML